MRRQPVFGAGQPQPFMAAGVDQCVGDDQIATLRQGRQQRRIGGEPGSQEQRRLAAEKRRRLGLQRFMLGMIAAQQPRAAGADRHPAIKRRAHRVGQHRRSRQPQVIVRGKVHARTPAQRPQTPARRQRGEIGLLGAQQPHAHARPPNKALPTRTCVAPSWIAVSKSPLIPIDRPARP